MSTELHAQRIATIHARLDDRGYGRPAPERTQTRSWVRWLTGQVYPDRAPSADDPVTNLVLQPLEELEERVRAHLDRTINDPAVLACCLLRSVARLAESEDWYAEGQDYVTARISDIRRWLFLLKRLVSMATGPDSTLFQRIALSLGFDVSALLFSILEGAIVGPALAALLSFEAVINRILGRAYDAVAETRCAPFIELWSIVLDWLYRYPLGFIPRARAFVLTTLIRSRREFMELWGDIGDDIDDALHLSREQAEAILSVIDLLLDATDLLARCPLPSPTYRDPDAERGRDPIRSALDGSSPVPGDDLTGGDLTDFPEDNELSGGGGEDGSAGGTLFADPRSPIDPEGPYGDDTAWLDPTNVARVLVRVGATPAEAVRLARAPSCSGELTDATRSALSRLGVPVS